MFIIPEEIIEKANQSKISVSHGRIGERNEYVEFVYSGSKYHLIAQNSRGMLGDHWFVYCVENGKDGIIDTLYQSNDFDDAVRSAYIHCVLIG